MLELAGEGRCGQRAIRLTERHPAQQASCAAGRHRIRRGHQLVTGHRQHVPGAPPPRRREVGIAQGRSTVATTAGGAPIAGPEPLGVKPSVHGQDDHRALAGPVDPVPPGHREEREGAGAAEGPVDGPAPVRARGSAGDQDR